MDHILHKLDLGALWSLDNFGNMDIHLSLEGGIGSAAFELDLTWLACTSRNSPALIRL